MDAVTCHFEVLFGNIVLPYCIRNIAQCFILEKVILILSWSKVRKMSSEGTYYLHSYHKNKK